MPIIVKGPMDINGNSRKFLMDNGSPDETTIRVTAEEYRRLAKRHRVTLNAADADEE